MGSRRGSGAGLLLVAALGVGAWATPDRGRRLDLLLAGVPPWATPAVEARVDFPYPESPLARALALDGAPDGGAGTLVAADGLARDVGFALLAEAGTGDLGEAERRLWGRPGGADRLAEAWALALQRRHVYLREAIGGRYRPDPVDPTYVRADDLALLLLHVGWALDLRMDAVRSPEHLYVVLREPGGAGARAIEPTCFRCVGAVDPGPERGPRLTFAEDAYRSGMGGIRNPPRLAPGTYAPVPPEGLDGAVLWAGALRAADLPALRAAAAEHPGDPAIAGLLRRALVAELGRALGDAGRLEPLAADLAALPPDPPDGALARAALLAAEGRRAQADALLAEVLAYWGPPDAGCRAAGVPEERCVPRPSSAAHAVALALRLEVAPADADRWNDAAVPLLNLHAREPDELARICALGARHVARSGRTPHDVAPACP